MKPQNIRRYFKKCTACKGAGTKWVESHGCWGENDSYTVGCPTCSGKGFTIDRALLSEIKKELAL